MTGYVSNAQHSPQKGSKSHTSERAAHSVCLHDAAALVYCASAAVVVLFEAEVALLLAARALVIHESSRRCRSFGMHCQDGTAQPQTKSPSEQRSTQSQQ